MKRQLSLFAVTFALLSSVALAGSLSEVAFLKAETKVVREKKKKKRVQGPEMLWIRLEPYQLRSVRRKTNVLRKQQRRGVERPDQRFAIDLSTQQKLAIRVAIKRKKPFPRRVRLWVDWSEVKSEGKKKRGRFYLVRLPDRFETGDPSDAQPQG